MYVVVINLYIDGGVQLDSSDLISEIFMLYRDIINMVMGNLAEDTAHMAHDTILSAVINLIVPDYVGTDRLLAPSDLSCPESAVGGVHGHAACAISKPRTVI